MDLTNTWPIEGLPKADIDQSNHTTTNMSGTVIEVKDPKPEPATKQPIGNITCSNMSETAIKDPEPETATKQPIENLTSNNMNENPSNMPKHKATTKQPVEDSAHSNTTPNDSIDPAEPDITHQRFRLMDLPKELRLNIYDHVFEDVFSEFPQDYPSTVWYEPCSDDQQYYPLMLPMLHTARKIRSEIVDSGILVRLASAGRDSLGGEADRMRSRSFGRYLTSNMYVSTLTRGMCFYEQMLQRLEEIRQNTTIV